MARQHTCSQDDDVKFTTRILKAILVVLVSLYEESVCSIPGLISRTHGAGDASGVNPSPNCSLCLVLEVSKLDPA